MTPLRIVADVFTVAGIILAGHGYARTWKQFGPGSTLRAAWWEQAVTVTTRLYRRVDTALRRILRRPSSATIHAATGSVSLGVNTGTAHLTVIGGLLPPIGDDPSAFAAEVHKRIADLQRRVGAAEGQLEQERAARIAGDEAIGLSLETQRGELETLTNRVAVNGIRETVTGWGLLIIGALLTLGLDAASACL